jgi:hypothetical protein
MNTRRSHLRGNIAPPQEHSTAMNVMGCTEMRWESAMKLKIVALAALALAASATMASAGPGKSGNAPGQMMHRYGSMGYPGASYWAHRKHGFRGHSAFGMSHYRKHHHH